MKEKRKMVKQIKKRGNRVKVLLVNGSPHEKGCTNRALQEVSVSLKKNGIETEIYWLGNQGVKGCNACRGCKQSHRCVFDDLVNEFIISASQADGFVFGTPVYYAGMNGNLSSFMDRVFYAAGKTVMRGKPAAGVVSCRRGGATAAFEQINKYFTISNMPIVSSQYWNMVHGSVADDVEKDEEGLQTMRTLGNNMAWLLKCIALGKQNGIVMPESETSVMTNFIR